MLTLFLSYARADGLAAASRLRAELELAGFTVWRDLEEMRGGVAWKEQLRAALRAVDAVLVLLTPAAVASANVGWEWENALTLQKKVIPLLILPCRPPDELAALHYHNLSDPGRYSGELAKLMRDLMALRPADPAAAGPVSSSKYVVHQANHSATGDQATVFNVAAPGRK